MSKDVLMIGDSLTEFFDWERRFPAHRVRNLGMAGETVEGLLDRSGRIAAKYPKADIVFLMTGINNMAMEDVAFMGSYRKLVEAFRRAWPHARLYVQGLLPTTLPWISDDTIAFLNSKIAAIAQECGAGYLDVYTAFKARGVRECLSADGVHLSDEGYRVWADVIEELVR